MGSRSAASKLTGVQHDVRRLQRTTESLAGAREYRPTLAPRFIEGGPSLIYDTVGSASTIQGGGWAADRSFDHTPAPMFTTGAAGVFAEIARVLLQVEVGDVDQAADDTEPGEERRAYDARLAHIVAERDHAGVVATLRVRN